jgi:hypothetical protein
MAQTVEVECSTFCTTCPRPEEVSNVLASLGFALDFTMPAEDEGAYMHLPPLPAQFHYEGPGGVRVIYLAGPDVALDGECCPEHESRFWLYGGHDQAVFQQVASMLAVRWSLSWQHGCSSSSLEDVA